MDGIFVNDIPAFTNNNVPDYSSSTAEQGTTSAGTPASMGGVPQVMPSNDWWKQTVSGAGDVIRTAGDIIKLRAANGVAVPAGVVASNAQNPAPGTKGLFFQANSTGGAGVSVPGSMNVGMILAAVAVVVVVLLIARKR